MRLKLKPALLSAAAFAVGVAANIRTSQPISQGEQMYLRRRLGLIVVWPVVTALAALLALSGGTPASASTAYLSGWVAFQANQTQRLWIDQFSPGSQAINTGYGIEAGTSPAILWDPTNTVFVAAFESNVGQTLCFYPEGTSANCSGLNEALSTSPSMADSINGGVEVAFQRANTHLLWLDHYDPSGDTNQSVNTGLGMAPDTSPSIINLEDQGTPVGFQVAFQNTQGYLCVAETNLAGTPTSNRCTGYGMWPDSSPSLSDAYDGGVVAFSGSGTADLWLYYYGGGVNDIAAKGTNLNEVMSPETSPSIGGDTISNGLFIAYQNINGYLAYWNTYAGNNNVTDYGMDPLSSPYMTFDDSVPGYGLTAGDYEIAFEANSGLLWMYDVADEASLDTGLGIYGNTGPSASDVS
jgi:hypothetical protein